MDNDNEIVGYGPGDDYDTSTPSGLPIGSVTEGTDPLASMPIGRSTNTLNNENE